MGGIKAVKQTKRVCFVPEETDKFGYPYVCKVQRRGQTDGQTVIGFTCGLNMEGE